MFFSIIMQSTLKDYPGAATDRANKLRRAIQSVLNQSFDDWELVIVADECAETMLVAHEFDDSRIVTHLAERPIKGKWYSYCRNVGNDLAAGRYRLYLDNDDYFTPHYLRYLHEEISRDMLDWYAVDHFYWCRSRWKYKHVELRPNSAGTANIVHSCAVRSRWPVAHHYGSEDWRFIKSIINELLTHRHIMLAGYCIAHIRGSYEI